MADLAQTVSTLRFASRAKTIKTQPKRMEMIKEDTEELSKLTELVESQGEIIKDKDTQIRMFKEVLQEVKATADRYRVKIVELEEQLAKECQQREGSIVKEVALLGQIEIMKKQIKEIKSRFEADIIMASEVAVKRISDTKRDKTTQTIINLAVERENNRLVDNNAYNDKTDHLLSVNSLDGKSFQPLTPAPSNKLKGADLSSSKDKLTKLFKEVLFPAKSIEDSSSPRHSPSKTKENIRHPEVQRDRKVSSYLVQHSVGSLTPAVKDSKLEILKEVDVSICQSIKEKRKRRLVVSLNREDRQFTSQLSVEDYQDSFYHTKTPLAKTPVEALAPTLAKLAHLKITFLSRLALLISKLTESDDKSTIPALNEFVSCVLSLRGSVLHQANLIQAYISTQSHKSTSSIFISKSNTKNGIETEGSALAKQRILKTFNASPEYFLMAWGDCSEGKVGIDPLRGDLTTPTFIPVGSVKNVALGAYFSMALDSKGRVLSWGRGELLGSVTVDRYKPIFIKELRSKVVVKIACGAEHSLALTSEGVVFSWGNEQFGQLGRGKVQTATQIKPSPVPKLLDKFINRIYAGPYSSAAITQQDELFVWGDNDPYKLFIPTSQQKTIPTPTRVLSSKCLLDISISQTHSVSMDLTSTLLFSSANTLPSHPCSLAVTSQSTLSPTFMTLSLTLSPTSGTDRPSQFVALQSCTAILTSRGRLLLVSSRGVEEVPLTSPGEKLSSHSHANIAVMVEGNKWVEVMIRGEGERIKPIEFDDGVLVSDIIVGHTHWAALYSKRILE